MSYLDYYILELIADTPKKKEIIYRETILIKKITKILNTLKKEPKAIIFLAKVTEKEAPNYFSIIKKPMDLGTIAKKIHLYRTLDEFKADLDLIWSNCLKYNQVGDYYRDCAFHCRDLADSLLDLRGAVSPVCPESYKIISNPILVREELIPYISKFFKEAGFHQIYSRQIRVLIEVLENEIAKFLKKYKEKENY